MAELYVLPDTNALLHFTRTDQLNWSTLASGADVVIVLTAVAVREIDKHANLHPVRRLKDRARGLKSWIRSHIGPGAPACGKVVVDVREPTAHFAPGLDPDVQDDRLIAAALMLQADGKAVAIFSDDTILQAKLPAFGVAGLWPEEGDRLKDEPDPVAAENDRLKRELAVFTSRRPQLAVEWATAKPMLDLVVYPANLDHIETPTEVRRKLMPMPDPGPSAETPQPATYDIAKLAELGKLGPGRQRILEYNAALEPYFTEYEAYYAKASARAAALGHVAELPFVAHNRGTAIATSFRASIQLPGGFRLLDPDRQLGEAPEPPTPPRKPGTIRLSDALGHVGRDRFPPAFARIPNLHRNWDDSPYLDTAAGVLRLRRDKLQHHHSFKFDPAFVLIDPSLVGGGAQFEVVITAEELPQPVSCGLAVRVRVAGAGAERRE